MMYSTSLELRDAINSLKSFGRRIALLCGEVDQLQEDGQSLLRRQAAVVGQVRPAGFLVTRELGPDALHAFYLTAHSGYGIVA